MNSKSLISNLIPILVVILTIIISWILVHLLAVFGVLLAVAYPIWWFISPHKVLCFFCRIQKEGKRCFACGQEVHADSLYPKTFFSALINTVLIVIISFVCVGFVFAESKVLFKLGFPPTPKTVSFIIPSKGQYRLGEVFPMKIDITGIKVPINAVQADIGFDPHKLEVVDVSTVDSFANIFIQKEINNEVGYVRLTGGLPNPGFFTDHGVFGTVFFKGITPGIVRIEFLPSSMVLANDGRGTNVVKDLVAVSYLILPDRISEEEAEMQESASIESVVLGETSENTQMKFYKETKVLGAKVGEEIQEEKKLDLTKAFLECLEKIDRFVLTMWEKVLSFLR